MNIMRLKMCVTCFVLSAMLTVGLQASPQTGAVEFVAKATPSSGTDEPIRGMTFYLLSKSFDEIGKEAAVTYSLVQIDAFVDKLEVSKELKSWMKKHHCVNLAGEDFIKKLKPDDVMDVPEFYKAYIERMSGDQSVAFPQPKYTPAEKKKNPAKYDEQVKQYHNAIRAFLVLNPKSTDGIDLALEDVNPGHQWDTIPSSSRNRNISSLAQTPICKGRALCAESLRALTGSVLWILSRRPVMRVSAGMCVLLSRPEKPATLRYRISTRSNLRTPRLKRRVAA
jgi:hypothetical protein